jgi:CelD/BcsL family acetyltransferase involved in cellulose biosynthesis
MKITYVDKYKDFLGLEKIWNGTLQKCENSSIFSTWEWLTLWWKYFGIDKELVLLLAENNGKIIGIAPLMYSVNKLFGLRIKKIEFIGTSASDYGDFILAEKSEECVKLFIDYLASIPEKWDLIELTNIPGTTISLSLLKKISGSAKFAHERVIYECPYIPLPRSLAAFTNGLSSKRRKTLRRSMRQLEKDFKVDFVDCSKTQALDQQMNVFFELHQRRCKAKGLEGKFSDQTLRKFHMDVERSFSEKSWLGLFLLRLADDPVAALYGFKYQSKFYYYLSGWDPRYSKYSIASLLIAHVISNCIQEGLAEFDFLRGAEEYKNQWNTVTRWNHQVVLTKNGFLATLQDSAYTTYWSFGSKLKHLLSR